MTNTIIEVMPVSRLPTQEEGKQTALKTNRFPVFKKNETYITLYNI